MSEILENGAAEPESDRTSAAFEDRPAHVPVLAAFLSAVAPGAGQVYNGDADRAWEFAGRALLVLPWVQSVRDALRRARAVREGDVDRPERGSLKRALTHVGILWSALLAVVIAGWLIAELVEGRWGEPTAAPGPTAAERRARALREAELTVHEARLTAWERTGEQPVEPKQRYTMSESERARRLYGIGWEHCRARKLAMCESAMRKVSELDSQYRRAAYRLQVWASVRRKEGGTNPSMPSVRPPGGPDAGLDAGGRDVAADAGVASPEGPDTVRTGRRDGSRGDGPRP